MHAATMTPPMTKPSRYVDEDAGSDERTYGMFNHLVGVVSVLSDGGIGFVSPIASVVMWRIKHKQSPFLDDHGREAVNFQLTLLLYFFAGTALLTVLTVLTLGVGALLIPLGWAGLVALRLVGCIRGAMAAHRGEYYRYPMSIRFIGEPDEA